MNKKIKLTASEWHDYYNSNAISQQNDRALAELTAEQEMLEATAAEAEQQMKYWKEYARHMENKDKD